LVESLIALGLSASRGKIATIWMAVLKKQVRLQDSERQAMSEGFRQIIYKNFVLLQLRLAQSLNLMMGIKPRTD